MSVLMINSGNFEAEVLKSEKKVLVDFFADWCGPCQMIAPSLHEIADEHPEYKICKINVDDEPQLAAAFKITSIPALFVLENGQVVNQALGARSKAQLLDMLK